MNNLTKQISVFQTFTLLLLSQFPIQILIIVPFVLEAVKRDSWISILLSLLLTFFLIPVVTQITKKRSSQKLPSWINQRSNNVIKGIMLGIIQLYLLLTAYMVCKQLVTHTKIIYLHKTPLVFLILPLLFLVFLIAKSGIQTIAICSGILYPLMFIFQMIAIFGNIPYVNLSMFTPVLENGIAGVWNALPWSISGFLDFLFLWVLISHFSEKDNNKTFMGVLILSGIVVLFVTVASVLIFGPFGAVTQRFPIFEQWRLVMISKYVEHVDFLFMFIRLSASMMRSVLCIYLSAGMVRWTSPSYRAWYLGGICALLFVLLLVPESDPHFVMASRKVYIPLIMFSSLIVLIVLWLLTFRRVEENM